MKDGTGLQYFLTDHLGSITAVTDSSGTLTSQQRYLPFGEVRTNVGAIAQTDFGYTGQRDLGDMGLMDYRARFYSNSLMRFIQPDSIIPNPSNPQGWNRYSYVMNRPVNFNDPSGHMCSDPDKENATCEGSAHVSTKVGNRMIRGDGKQRSYAIPKKPAEPCVKCHTTPSAPPVVITVAPPPVITATEPTYESNEIGLEGLFDYAVFMNNGVDFVQGLDIATNLLKKGFLWGKAINPDPRLDFILGVAGQAIADLDNPNLTLGQRIGRVGVVGLESMATGLASDAAGALGFIAGEIIALEGGGIVGYAGAALFTSIYLDEKVWRDYNQSKFEGWGLGSFP